MHGLASKMLERGNLDRRAFDATFGEPIAHLLAVVRKSGSELKSLSTRGEGNLVYSTKPLRVAML